MWASLISGFLWTSVGLAQEPAAPAEPAPAEPAPSAPAEVSPPTTPEPAVDITAVSADELIIWGERYEAARDRLDHDLRAYGYKRGRTRDGWTTYRRTGPDNWKPKVKVNEDGLMVFRYTNVAFSPPVARGQPQESVAHTPGAADRGDLTVQFPMRFPSHKLQNQEKGRVVAQLTPNLQAIQAATAAKGEAVLLAQLPSLLDEIWKEGKDARSGATYADPTSRQAALIELYATRADTRAGLAARDAIEDYLQEEVVPTHPLPQPLQERADQLGIQLR